MKVVLAIIGSRDLGEPYYPSDIFTEGGTALYPVYRNIAQFNYAIRRLNEAVVKITSRSRSIDPSFDPRRDIEVVTGDAVGADEIGRLWARKNQICHSIKCAKWLLYGKSAGHRRNPDIIIPADYVVAFWDGVSRGTEGSIKIAKKHGKRLMVIKYLKHAPNLKKKVNR
jgi:hypothetical protein